MSDNVGIVARGKELTNIARNYGVYRRWFGLEPDFIFRKRVYVAIEAFAVSIGHRKLALLKAKQVKPL